MAEESGGNSPPDRENPSNQGGNAPRRRPRKFRKNRHRKPDSAKPSFKGPLPGYEKCVYEISKNSGSDAFSTTTRKLSEYVSRTVPNAGKFINAMNPDDLGFDEIAEPNDPRNGTSAIQLEK